MRTITLHHVARKVMPSVGKQRNQHPLSKQHTHTHRCLSLVSQFCTVSFSSVGKQRNQHPLSKQ